MRKTIVENLFEISIAREAPIIDAESGIIRDVKILGTDSGNGRFYAIDVMQKAKTLYDGISVNVNHGDRPGDKRDYGDRIGILKNIKVKESGIFGDLFFNPQHERASQLAWDAVNAPENVGLSHDAKCRTFRRNGVTTVEEILSVNSVDLVGSPATTGSLFEQESKTMKTTIGRIAKATLKRGSGATKSNAKLARNLLQLCEQDALAGDIPVADLEVDVPAEANADEAIKAAFRAAIMAVIDDPSLDVKEMMDKIRQLLMAEDKITSPTGGGAVTDLATGTEDLHDPEEDAKRKKDEEMKEELGSLRRSLEVSELLRSSGATVTEEVVEALCREPDKAKRKKLLEQFGGAPGNRDRVQKPRSTGAGALFEQQGAANGNRENSQDFAGSLGIYHKD